MASPSTTREFPGFDCVFKLGDPVAGPPFRGRFRATEQEAIAFLRGEAVPAHPVLVEHAMGGKPSDFIWTTLVVPRLISDRVAGLLREAKVTGWSLFPVRVVGKDGAEIHGFYGLAVVGRCGPIDSSRGEYCLKPPPVPQGKAFWIRKGIFFEPDSWDGSDIFAPLNRGSVVFVVDRVKRLLERAKVRNVRLTRVSEYEAQLLQSELPPGLHPAE